MTFGYHPTMLPKRHCTPFFASHDPQRAVQGGSVANAIIARHSAMLLRVRHGVKKLGRELRHIWRKEGWWFATLQIDVHTGIPSTTLQVWRMELLILCGEVHDTPQYRLLHVRLLIPTTCTYCWLLFHLR